MLKHFCCTLILSMLVFSSAQALQLQSACYYNLSTGEHQDTDPNKQIEIASLSKILTSHWALNRLGTNFRFVTKLHLRPIGKNPAGVDVYDLHIEGGFDPVFTRDRLQYVVALLNNNKITSLRHITFDENFIFVDNLAMVASSDSSPHDPSLPRTKNNLTQAFSKLSNTYPQTRNRALQMYKMNLPSAIKISFASLSYKTKAEFKQQAMANETLVEVQSIPLKEILSEMNQQSNNHIADFLFQYLGSTAGYLAFAQKNLNVDTHRFDIRNGSGNPIFDNEGRKFYNSTSCSMIISVLAELKKYLSNASLGLNSIFSTVGVDIDPKDKSPASSNYLNAITDHAVVAKTGTIDPTIGLAGVLSTKNGEILFSILYGTEGPTEWKKARVQILEDITIVLEKNQPRPINASDKVFLSFDNLSLKKK